MDVRLPDGTLIQGVPDGTTKAQLIEKLQGKGYDVSGLIDQASKKQLAEPTAGERTLAGTSGIVRGVAGLAGLPVDTAHNAINLAAAAGHAALSPFMDTGVFNPPLHGGIGSSEDIAKRLEAGGLSATNPRPDDAASRMLFTGGTIVGGTPGKPQVAPAAMGALAAEVTGDPRFAAVGASVPQAAAQASAAARQAISNRVWPNVEEFKNAGTTPSVGQATELNFVQGLENLISKFPGGQGVFRKFAEKQQTDLGASRQGVSAEDAGRAIEGGVKGFMGRTKETWLKLDDEVAAKAGNTTAYTTNTKAALDELTKPAAGVDVFVNPKIAQIKETLASNPSFQELRELRSRIGAMVDDSLISGVPQGEIKKLYGAISKDLEAAANQAGAGKEFARQSEYYRARMDRIENVLDRVLGKTPEETFQRFFPKDPNQVTTVRAVMRSLDPEQRSVVQEAVVDRLGRAKSGKQDDTGQLFSPETFLTNWNNLSPGAKAQIFSDPAVRRNMDSVASVTANIREGAQVFANPSGTAGATAPYGLGYLVGRALVDVASGNLPSAAYHGGLAVAMPVGAGVGAKMLTSPGIVEWLAQAPKVEPGREAAHLARLAVIFNQTKDPELKAELTTFMQKIQ